ncbi:MAG: CHASE domain-containing sensor histidine kinase [Prochlorothrix sp.]
MRRLSASPYPLSKRIALGTGVALTLMAMAWAARWDHLGREYELRRQSRNLTTALERTTNRYGDLLLSLRDLHSAIPGPVSAETFQKFVQRSIQTYPGIQALEWTPLVLDRDRQTYEQTFRQSAPDPNFAITERDSQGKLIPAKRRPFYVPVTYLEPLQYNEIALGYDLASDPTRFAALKEAFNTGLPTATGRIQLVQETKTSQYSFLLFVPVNPSSPDSEWRPGGSAAKGTRAAPGRVEIADPLAGHPTGTEARSFPPLAQPSELQASELQGYWVGVFRIADVVEAALQGLNHNLSFYILDKTAPVAEQMLGFYDQNQKKLTIPTFETAELSSNLSLVCSPAHECQQSLQVGQRTWQLVFVPQSSAGLPWSVGAVGAIGALITYILWVFLSQWQKELDRTREMSDLKLKLFSMASHELRTPLSIITLSSQFLLLQGHDLTPPEQRRRIERIQDSAQRLGQLVNDLLTLARAEAGKLEVDRAIVDIKLLLERIVESIPLKPGQLIKVDGLEETSLVYIDAKILTSILTNLMANASKYSPEGGLIQIILSQRDQVLCICIQDQGIGIPVLEQDRVLEAFYRASNTGKIPGTGLGLAVVKTCVDYLEGSLEIQTNMGEGTCITVKIPCLE